MKSKKIYIRAQQLPEPWKLDNDWFDRLEISEKDRRHYGHLSEIERRKVETDRLLVEHYTHERLLTDGWTKERLLNRVAEDVDRTWLKPGKGRAVDFKNTLAVLETYARYCAWALQYQETDCTTLDVVIPYLIKIGWPYHNSGPGFVQVQIKLYQPWIAAIGYVYYESGTFSITELTHTFDKAANRFLDEPCKPFNYLPNRLSRRFFARPEEPFGLVEYIKDIFKSVVTGKPKLSEQTKPKLKSAVEGSYFGDSNIEVRLQRPVVEDLQLLLDVFSRWHFESRVPKTRWQLRFEVKEDFRVHALSLFLGRSPFGCFFQETERR